jgi:fibro-slime domain-containing protein
MHVCSLRVVVSLGSVLLACGGSSSVVSSGGDAGSPVPGRGIPEGPVISCPPKGCADSPPHCGDGALTMEEACDDGNLQGGDGCAGNCLSVERGYSCAEPGRPCRVTARCGDGLVAGAELCDDGNKADGDGCSKSCQLERDFKCEGQPSECVATTCGDGKIEGAESCEDGNALPFDGCSAHCQSEPRCDSTGGACTSRCGDGIVLDEQCDDGNLRGGDGCSATCTREPGFSCTTSSSCTMRDGQCSLLVAAVFRDFDAEHQDFQIGCGTLQKGIVQPALDDEGKPVLARSDNACIASASSFAEWYRSSRDNTTLVGELTLYDNGRGGFVNRHGAKGEPWLGPETFANVVWGGDAGSGCSACTVSAAGRCYDPCTPWGAGNTSGACCAESTQQRFDGTPLFFPVDASARKDARLRAKIPEQYGYTGWPWEDAVVPGAGAHNFSFTTEVVYWFQYDPSRAAMLDFSGDDDLWVFVNGKLAVDLGGAHVPSPGQVTIDTAAAATFGLEPGKVYPIHVFHAERKAEGSSFKLTLDGFNTARSECTALCGDAVVAAGEECDDGVNDGGYGECEPGCRLGPSCGDGIVQDSEDCDDGNRIDDDGCGSSCRHILLI